MLAAVASSTTTPTSPDSLNIPVPEFTPTNTDLAPQRSFLRELCTKVANYWTSTFHSSRHLDNLEKVAQFIPNIHKQMVAWEALATSTGSSSRDQIAVVGGAVGAIIKKGAEEALATIAKFNNGIKQITGCDLSTLTGEKRRELSTEQRAKVSALYTSLNGAFTDGEQQFNQIGTALAGVSTAISALLKKDAEIKADFKQVGADYSYKETNLNSPEILNLAPNLYGRLNNIYSQNQTKIFGELAKSAEAGPDAIKITEAATVATTELEKTQEAINSIVNSVNEAVETLKQNNKTRAGLTDMHVPQEDTTVVTVAQATFDAVNKWFNSKADEAESAIKNTLEKIDTLETLDTSDLATKTFAKNSQEYRDTVQAIGKAILPFDTLAKTEGATALFNDTVGKLKDIVEKATVDILGKGESHEVTMGKLQKLQELSAIMAKQIQAELSTNNNLTTDEATTLLSIMTDDVSKIITTNRFSRLV